MATGRRPPGKLPRLVGRPWNDAARDLYEYLGDLFNSYSGLPFGFGNTTGTGQGPGSSGGGSTTSTVYDDIKLRSYIV